MYDRILSVIPNVERQYLQHVFKWIMFYESFIPQEGIPRVTLLEGVDLSLEKLGQSHVDRFYDQTILQEYGGCLITLRPFPGEETPGHNTVSFAHFTVREYLGSAELSRQMPFWPLPQLKMLIVNIMLGESTRFLIAASADRCDQPEVEGQHSSAIAKIWTSIQWFMIYASMLIRHWASYDLRRCFAS